MKDGYQETHTLDTVTGAYVPHNIVLRESV